MHFKVEKKCPEQVSKMAIPESGSEMRLRNKGLKYYQESVTFIVRNDYTYCQESMTFTVGK